MATLTRLQVMDLALEAIAIKPAGVTASAEDADIIGKAFDSVYHRLRKYGLTPFSTSEIPEWAWSPLTNSVAADAAPRFGVTGQRLSEWTALGRAGERELARQIAGYRHSLQIEADFF